MSVFQFSPDELAAMLGTYKMLAPALYPGAPSPHDLELALVGAYYANTAAFCATYDDAVVGVVVTPIHTRLAAVPTSPRPAVHLVSTHACQLVRDLRSLLYNCTANNGADFLPALYRDVIQRAIEGVLDRLVGLDATPHVTLAAA